MLKLYNNNIILPKYLEMVKENNPAEKSFCRSEDGSAGGGWGEECRAVRAKSAEPRPLLVQSRTPKKSFVFLLEEKIRRAQIRKCEQNFSLGGRALASGGGAVQSFRSKWVRAKFRIEQYIYFFIFSNSESRALLKP